MSWSLHFTGPLEAVRAEIETKKFSKPEYQQMFEAAKPKLLAIVALSTVEVTHMRISASGSTHKRGTDPYAKTIAAMAVTVEHIGWEV